MGKRCLSSSGEIVKKKFKKSSITHETISKILEGKANDLYGGKRISVSELMGHCSYPILLEDLFWKDSCGCFKLNTSEVSQLVTCSCSQPDEPLEVADISRIYKTETTIDKELMKMALGCSAGQMTVTAVELLYHLDISYAFMYLYLWLLNYSNLHQYKIVLTHKSKYNIIMASVIRP